MKEEGRIDMLVNNAGFGLSGYLETVHVDEAKALFEVNVWGVVRMLHATLPHMRKARRGYVINISSTSGMRGIPCFDFYTSSKFALEGMTDSMRYALAPFNISVTNLNAGPVVTKFTDRFGIGSSLEDITSFLILESIETWGGFHSEILMKPVQWEDGFVIPSSEPGLGVELNEAVAEANPYTGSMLHLEMTQHPVL
jgi:short-subunit dehydrogenase